MLDKSKGIRFLSSKIEMLGGRFYVKCDFIRGKSMVVVKKDFSRLDFAKDFEARAKHGQIAELDYKKEVPKWGGNKDFRYERK